MSEQEMDLSDYLIVLKSRIKMFFCIVFVGIFITAFFLLKQSSLYQTTAVIEQAKIDKNPVESAENLDVLFKKSLNPYLRIIGAKMNVPEKEIFNLTDMFGLIDLSNPGDIKVTAGYILVWGKDKTPEKAKELVDLICDLIIQRQNEIVENALKIVNDDLNDIKKQIEVIKKDVEIINSKIFQKEKTDILAQSYIFQTLAESKENALKRQYELQNRLLTKEMEMKYYTKLAALSAPASLPKVKVSSNKIKVMFISTIVSFIAAVFIVFIYDYFKKNPL